MKCPDRVHTQRLVLRRATGNDAAAIFAGYAADNDVGRYLGWPVHRTIDDTQEFLQFSDREWKKWPAGPYLIFSRDESRLLGSTGLAFESPSRASTGYVIAKAYWGNGYASEALSAIQELSRATGLERLYALCHPDHLASQNVLTKCGFRLEADRRKNYRFPNHDCKDPQDALCFVWAPGAGALPGVR